MLLNLFRFLKRQIGFVKKTFDQSFLMFSGGLYLASNKSQNKNNIGKVSLLRDGNEAGDFRNTSWVQV